MSATRSDSARAEILSRIRTALADRPTAPVPVVAALAGAGDPDLFAERVADYRALVRRCAPADVAATIAAAIGDRRVVVPDGFPQRWLPAAPVRDDPELTIAELEALDGVVTTCAVAIAETGTVVLDTGPGQGRRALTLLPDWHLVVVRAEQIVAGVPEAIDRLDALQPTTWISGPSATSDIELNRVEGVHGPRHLEIVLTQ